MTPTTIAAAFLILAGGAGLQAACGFGLGMSTVPLLLWLGFALPDAVSMVLGVAGVQTIVGLAGHREHIDLKHSLPIAGFQALGTPLGVLAMAWLAALGKEPLQQAVGAGILVGLVVRQLVKPTPRRTVPFWWGALAGGGTGFLAAMVGMGGPPMVFYALSHEWGKDKFRTFIWTQFLLGNPVLVAALVWRFSPSVLPFFALGVAGFPLVYVGSKLGIRLTQGWDAERTQQVAVVLLAMLGLSSLLRPMFG